MLNPFQADAFDLWSLGAAIERLPNNYGRVRELGLFRSQPITGRQVAIDEYEGKLNLLKTMPVGSPGQKSSRGTRHTRGFIVPHIPYDDFIQPDEYANIRAYGTEDGTKALAQIMNDHLQSAKDKHAITLEYLRMGALKGIIYDADGSEIYDLFKEFLITKKRVNFALNNASTEVITKCHELKRHIEKNLKGEIMRGIRVLVDEDFFDALVTHDKVKDAYARWRDGELLRSDVRKGFQFGGITWEEYVGTCPDADNVSRKFIDAKEGIAFPEGTRNTFINFFSPADFLETANTRGRPYYAKTEAMEFNRGVKIHTQSNPLPLCMRPEVLVEVYTP